MCGNCFDGENIVIGSPLPKKGQYWCDGSRSSQNARDEPEISTVELEKWRQEHAGKVSKVRARMKSGQLLLPKPERKLSLDDVPDPCCGIVVEEPEEPRCP